MQFVHKVFLGDLAKYIGPFITLVGNERWFKRVDHFDNEQAKSPFLAKIIADYHWLEMELSCKRQPEPHLTSLS